MDLILKPVISEKSEIEKTKHNVYQFVVKRNANKIELKKQIEEQYNVEIVKINTFIKAEKTKRRNTKTGQVLGKATIYKRAIVKLKDGDTIDFYSAV